MIQLGKANSVFGWLGRMWASKSISIKVKVRLYEALTLAVLLYGAETWLIIQATTKKWRAGGSTQQELCKNLMKRPSKKGESQENHSTS